MLYMLIYVEKLHTGSLVIVSPPTGSPFLHGYKACSVEWRKRASPNRLSLQILFSRFSLRKMIKQDSHSKKKKKKKKPHFLFSFSKAVSLALAWLSLPKGLALHISTTLFRITTLPSALSPSTYSTLLHFLKILIAAPAAYGSSQARGPISGAAVVLHHSHGNTGSEWRLQPTRQLVSTPDL